VKSSLKKIKRGVERAHQLEVSGLFKEKNGRKREDNRRAIKKEKISLISKSFLKGKKEGGEQKHGEGHRREKATPHVTPAGNVQEEGRKRGAILPGLLIQKRGGTREERLRKGG